MNDTLLLKLNGAVIRTATNEQVGYIDSGNFYPVIDDDNGLSLNLEELEQIVTKLKSLKYENQN